jgi:hypothetical protein
MLFEIGKRKERRKSWQACESLKAKCLVKTGTSRLALYSRLSRCHAGRAPARPAST